MTKTKPRGYFKDICNGILEAEFVKSEHDLDRLPSASTLTEMGYSGLSCAIVRYHGGFRKFRELLGEDQRRKPIRYWKSIDNFLKEIDAAKQKEGWTTLPNQRQLCESGYSMIVSAIKNYHGGSYKVRELLGEDQKRLKGYFNDICNVILECEFLKSEHGWETLPQANKLTKEGYGGLVTSISRHHGGFHKVRELLGEKQKESPKGIWKNLEYTIDRATEVIEQQGYDTLPTRETLMSLGHGGLAKAICNHHGGIIAFRELLRQSQGLPSERQQLEGILESYVGDAA